MNDMHLKIAMLYKQAGPASMILQGLYKNFGKAMGSGGRDIARRAVTGFMPGAGLGAVGGFMMPGGGGKDLMGRDIAPSFGDRLHGALSGGLYGGMAGAVGNVALGGPAARLKPGDMSKLKSVPNSLKNPNKGPAANTTPIKAQGGTGRGKTRKTPGVTTDSAANTEPQPGPLNRQYGTSAPMGGVDLKRGVPSSQSQNQALGNRRISNPQELKDLQARRRTPGNNSWGWKTPALLAGAFGATGLPLLFHNNYKKASGNMAKIALERYPEKYRAKIAAMGLFQPLGIGLGLAGVGYGAYKLMQENNKTQGGLRLNPFSAISDIATNMQKGK